MTQKHNATQKTLTTKQRALRARLAANEKELRESEEKLVEITARLRAEVVEIIKKSLAVAAGQAPINESMSQEAARNVVMDYLIDTQRVPVHPLVCKMLTEKLDFDASLIAQGEFGGVEVGFIPGLPLLKFVGFVHFDAPTLQEAAALMSLEDGATKH